MTINGTVEEILQVYNDCLTFTGKRSEFTLKATNKTWDGTLEWSTDHNTWTKLTGTEAMQSVDKKLYLRGKGNTTFCKYGFGVQWNLSEKADCIGNIQTLLDWENPPTSIRAYSCYDSMFYLCSNLTSAPELPAANLARSCYYRMFAGCANLTSAPELPATTLADRCYESMFSVCTNLTTAPELPATTLAGECYYSMFDGCTKLKVNDTSGNKIFTCPSNIPYGAVTNMFSNTGGTFTGTPTEGNAYYGTVEDIPQVYNDCLTFTGKSSEFTLKATNKTWDGTLEWSTDHNTWTTLTGTEAIQSVDKKLYLRGKGNTTFFEYGFGVRWQLSEKADCVGNIQTLLDWENPPTRISVNYCYGGMFEGCTSLTSAPELPATTLADSCYYSMFYGCTSLTNAPELPATTLADGCYSCMFLGCTNLTSAPELSATTLAYRCYDGMFIDCTNLTSAPELPATTLAESCYAYMFNGCTSLTNAPELPATTLAEDCYRGMFSSCTKLKVNITSGNKIFKCPSTMPEGAVEYMFDTGDTLTGTPTAGKTYYYTVSMR